MHAFIDLFIDSFIDSLMFQIGINGRPLPVARCYKLNTLMILCWYISVTLLKALRKVHRKSWSEAYYQSNVVWLLRYMAMFCRSLSSVRNRWLDNQSTYLVMTYRYTFRIGTGVGTGSWQALELNMGGSPWKFWQLCLYLHLHLW